MCNKLLFYFVLGILGILILNCSQNKEENMIKEPVAKRQEHIYEIHGQKINDPYFWLRDSTWPEVQDKEIISYLNEENEYTNKKFFDNHVNLKNKMFEELKSRIKLADQSTYIKKGEYYYYTRTEEDKDYKIHCRKFGSIDAEEEIILDENELAKDEKFMKVGAVSVSPDHNYLAYSVDTTGGERFTIKILDLKTKQHLSDTIDDVIGSIVWHENIFAFFYTPCDEKWRTNQVFFHKIGEKDDNLIFEEKDDLYRIFLGKSNSKQYLFICVSGHAENEYHIINIKNNNDLVPQIVKPRTSNHLYSIEHNGDYLYILTNDIGSNFRLAKAKISDLSNWEEFIPMDEKKYLDDFDITEKHLILNYKDNGLPLVRIHNISDINVQKDIEFPDEVYTANGYSTNFTENDIRVNYSSLKRPNTVYSYDFDRGDLSVLKVQEIPCGFNPDDYEVKRLWANNDGVNVPISLLYKKSLFKGDGSNPLYLIGYGSYSISIYPSFKNNVFPLVDRGFVFAIAHIRGEDYLGYKWYEDGKLLNKKNSFADFIACTKHLINQKCGSEGNVFISSGSAGGLLIGNVINSNPELYKAAIAHVPFVDFMGTMLDDTLPLTPGEYKEWGNPQDKKYFDYMMSYSPYDNVKEQKYPHLFITAGLNDPRVGYWEAAKWVAKLRDMKTDNNLLLLKTNMDFGHSGASGRFDYLKEVADDYVFILKMHSE